MLLIRFAHRFGAYDWSNDPEQPKQAVLLQQLAAGNPEDPVEGDDEFSGIFCSLSLGPDRFNEEIGCDQSPRTDAHCE